MSASVPKSHNLQIILSSIRTLRTAKSRWSSYNNDTDYVSGIVLASCGSTGIMFALQMERNSILSQFGFADNLKNRNPRQCLFEGKH